MTFQLHHDRRDEPPYGHAPFRLDDPSAFERAFAASHDAIFRYVASRVGVPAAPDVVHDTFEQAFARRASFDPTRSASPLPWLLGIATRRIARHRDAERRWLRARIETPIEVPTTPGAGSREHHARMDAAATRAALARALERMPRRERDPFLLHVLGELTYEDVAVALDVPVGTVRSRISRGRARLQALLTADEEARP